MTPDLTLPGTVLISTCIIAGGILTGAQAFSINVPFASYVMVALAVFIVLGAGMLVLSCRSRGTSPS
ncbi:MAG TPA: hypothetical protein PLG75_11145 [Methanoculleus sp.]|nr:hypothetical protein [Methanoculleus sp.]